MPFMYIQCLRITLQGWSSLFATLTTASIPLHLQPYKLKHIPRRCNAEQIEYCLKEFRDHWDTLGVEEIVRDLR